jgi:hypothetical protein
MDKYHLHWYTDEIEVHAASCIASYRHLLDLLSNPKTKQTRGVWFALVSFLTHAAIVSKLLDPIKEASFERGKELREHLHVPADSPLLPRAARDNLEHIDERIDNWVKRKESAALELVVDDREGFNFITSRKPAIRRVLINNEMVFISEDRNGAWVEVDLKPLYEAIQNLSAVCQDKLANESPYTYKLAQALRNYEP